MILLGLYRGIWWSSYRGIKLKYVNKWLCVLMQLLNLHRCICGDRGMEEANGICSFKQRGLFSANSLI